MMSAAVAALLLLSVCSAEVYFQESFENGLDGWTASQATKDGAAADIAKYNGKFTVNGTDADGHTLALAEANRLYALAAPLTTPFAFGTEPLVVQYEVQFENGVECGGAYIKLISQAEGLDLSQFRESTPYTILFGPDRCGPESHLRFIYRHKNPKTGQFREIAAVKVPNVRDLLFSDKKTHLLTLIVRPSNTFSMMIDMNEVLSGDLRSDESFAPGLTPPKIISDPNEKKPADWVDSEEMDDPTDEKPADWDQPEMIPDPNSHIPAEWDEDSDGVWEPSQIKNPAYKGVWRARQIPNPAYKGEWEATKIPNPDYFEDANPFSSLTPIAAAGFELWTITAGFHFDNILITTDEAAATAQGETLWKPKRAYQDAVQAASETSIFAPFKTAVMDLVAAAEQQPLLWVVYALALFIPAWVLFRAVAGKPTGALPDIVEMPSQEEVEGEQKQEEGQEASGQQPQAEKEAEAEPAATTAAAEAPAAAEVPAAVEAPAPIPSTTATPMEDDFQPASPKKGGKKKPKAST